MTRPAVRRGVVATLFVVCGMFGVSPGVGDRRDPGITEAITALKRITVAEIQHASIYGYYDGLDCLIVPRCVPREAFMDEGFLSADWAADAERRGYRIEFIAGPPADLVPNDQMSRTALSRFAVRATPVDPRGTERRAFCTDDRNQVFASRGGLPPRVENGRCVDDSEPLG